MVGPSMLAALVNNLAAKILFEEWAPPASENSLPSCHTRLKKSSAAPFINLAKKINPSSFQTLMNQGRVAWLEGDCSLAKESWEKALKASPGNLSTAYWLYWLNDPFTHDLPGKLEANHLARYFELAGGTAEQVGFDNAAISNIELSLFHVPTKNTAEYLINLYKKTNQVEKIPTAWQLLVSSLPKDNPDYWWAQGQLAELDQDWSSAAGYYEKGAGLIRDPYPFLMAQGDAYKKLQDWKSAEEVFKAAVKARPDNTTLI